MLTARLSDQIGPQIATWKKILKKSSIMCGSHQKISRNGMKPWSHGKCSSNSKQISNGRSCNATPVTTWSLGSKTLRRYQSLTHHKPRRNLNRCFLPNLKKRISRSQGQLNPSWWCRLKKTWKGYWSDMRIWMSNPSPSSSNTTTAIFSSTWSSISTFS